MTTDFKDVRLSISYGRLRLMPFGFKLSHSLFSEYPHILGLLDTLLLRLVCTRNLA
jgi:hypothetical protein